VIVLSGSELKEDMHEAYAVGANSYLVKTAQFDSRSTWLDIGAQLPAVSRPPGGAAALSLTERGSATRSGFAGGVR